uniref:Uncharacterized protein n=1 Tax=Oryza barthii TaxID=65489 RepID=A0A0D3GIT0_9ORYZ
LHAASAPEAQPPRAASSPKPPLPPPLVLSVSIAGVTHPLITAAPSHPCRRRIPHRHRRITSTSNLPLP